MAPPPAAGTLSPLRDTALTLVLMVTGERPGGEVALEGLVLPFWPPDISGPTLFYVCP